MRILYDSAAKSKPRTGSRFGLPDGPTAEDLAWWTAQTAPAAEARGDFFVPGLEPPTGELSAPPPRCRCGKVVRVHRAGLPGCCWSCYLLDLDMRDGSGPGHPTGAAARDAQ